MDTSVFQLYRFTMFSCSASMRRKVAGRSHGVHQNLITQGHTEYLKCQTQSWALQPQTLMSPICNQIISLVVNYKGGHPSPCTGSSYSVPQQTHPGSCADATYQERLSGLGAADRAGGFLTAGILCPQADVTVWQCHPDRFMPLAGKAEEIYT